MSEILDQTSMVDGEEVSAVGVNPPASRLTLAQTFTVGITGNLVQIDLQIVAPGMHSYSLLAHIVRCADIYTPLTDSAHFLHTEEFPAAMFQNSPDNEELLKIGINLRGYPPAVAAGDILAIVLETDTPIVAGPPFYAWRSLILPPYNAGQSLTYRDTTGWQPYRQPGAFFSFWSYVDVP